MLTNPKRSTQAATGFVDSPCCCTHAGQGHQRQNPGVTRQKKHYPQPWESQVWTRQSESKTHKTRRSMSCATDLPHPLDDAASAFGFLGSSPLCDGHRHRTKRRSEGGRTVQLLAIKSTIKNHWSMVNCRIPRYPKTLYGGLGCVPSAATEKYLDSKYPTHSSWNVRCSQHQHDSDMMQQGAIIDQVEEVHQILAVHRSPWGYPSWGVALLQRQVGAFSQLNITPSVGHDSDHI